MKLTRISLFSWLGVVFISRAFAHTWTGTQERRRRRAYRAPPPLLARGRVPRSRRRPYRPGPAFGGVSAARTGVAAVARRLSASSAAASRRATVAQKGKTWCRCYIPMCDWKWCVTELVSMQKLLFFSVFLSMLEGVLKWVCVRGRSACCAIRTFPPIISCCASVKALKLYIKSNRPSLKIKIYI